jgi:glucose/arabinose dehydrogenase
MDRLFIVEQPGTIKVYNKNDQSVSTFLTVDDVVTGGEQGLLGLAFHPDYATTGRFYVNYTSLPDTGRETRVAQYNVSGDPDVADATSEQILLQFNQPAINHNAGWMDFSPNDGYLYIATGDGGASSETAQQLDSLLGKILRIEVGDGTYTVPNDNPFVGQTNVREETWAYGLRNPWRNSFDRQTGDLWIADVGSYRHEEVNFQPASSDGGENYGWPRLEGTFPRNPPEPDNDVLPLFEYDHIDRGAITGGYVLRGPNAGDLEGLYIFADLTGRVWTIEADGTNLVERTAELLPEGETSLGTITSFGEDAAGNLYIVARDGEIRQIVPEPATLSLLLAGTGLVILRRRRR